MKDIHQNYRENKSTRDLCPHANVNSHPAHGAEKWHLKKASVFQESAKNLHISVFSLIQQKERKTVALKTAASLLTVIKSIIGADFRKHMFLLRTFRSGLFFCHFDDLTLCISDDLLFKNTIKTSGWFIQAPQLRNTHSSVWLVRKQLPFLLLRNALTFKTRISRARTKRRSLLPRSRRLNVSSISCFVQVANCGALPPKTWWRARSWWRLRWTLTPVCSRWTTCLWVRACTQPGCWTASSSCRSRPPWLPSCPLPSSTVSVCTCTGTGAGTRCAFV